ncbi:MAG TPA: biotin--[acetyl-CoA-carboxylase] ligase [Nitrososphaeraceae archaeon]|jgi:BirA family biotin operon repressor/biotin-[acetyl-CoA-carboxylase] ligase|nr:biotin--[acetyl-CoA-carboxylase] ligase [Nitrososphaeraceae archaeon]
MDQTHNNIDLGLQDLVIGKRIYHYKKIKSTQQLAISFAETNINNEHGTVIVADEQDEGIGRGKKKWASPIGGLWMSLIIKPRIEFAKVNIISVISAISVCEAINDISQLKTSIKWPNDILINEKKLAGILIDTNTNNSKNDYIVVGIGINIDVDIPKINLSIASNNILPTKVTSIHNEIKVTNIDRFILMKHLLGKIEFYLSLLEHDKYDTKIIEIYKKLSNTLGKRIIVYHEGLKKYSGIVKDIDNSGGLILERDDKLLEIIYSGEITIREQNDR